MNMSRRLFFLSFVVFTQAHAQPWVVEKIDLQTDVAHISFSQSSHTDETGALTLAVSHLLLLSWAPIDVPWELLSAQPVTGWNTVYVALTYGLIKLKKHFETVGNAFQVKRLDKQLTFLDGLGTRPPTYQELNAISGVWLELNYKTLDFTPLSAEQFQFSLPFEEPGVKVVKAAGGFSMGWKQPRSLPEPVAISQPAETSPVVSRLAAEAHPPELPRYTDSSQHSQWVSDIIPWVEAETGRTFRQVPPVRWVTRIQLEMQLQIHLRKILEVVFPGRIGLARMASQKAREMAPSVSGMFFPHNRWVCVVGEAICEAIRRAGVDPGQQEVIEKTILAHELTHALQDEQFPKGVLSVLSVGTPEARLASRAVIEGHASFVQRAVGRKLGLSDDIGDRAQLLASDAVDVDSLESLMAGVGKTLMRLIYLQGRNFIEHHAGQGDVWSVVLNPPQYTSMVLAPHTYRPGKISQTDFSPVFSELAVLGRSDWGTEHLVLGAMMNFAMMSQMDARTGHVFFEHTHQLEMMVFKGKRHHKDDWGAVKVALVTPGMAEPLVRLLNDHASPELSHLGFATQIETTMTFESKPFQMWNILLAKDPFVVHVVLKVPQRQPARFTFMRSFMLERVIPTLVKQLGVLQVVYPPEELQLKGLQFECP